MTIQFRQWRPAAVMLALSCLVAGCANPVAMGITHPGRGSAPILNGPGITANRTPIDDALACFGSTLRRAGKAGVGIAVGEVRDFTGRVTDLEGAQITQGGGLMVYSALGKMGGAVRMHERLDPRVGEVELVWTDRRQLGDGRRHRAQVGQQQQEVPWIPYYGGSIRRSDYFIVGGITELNQTISSGGIELALNMVGGRARYMVINVAADLRIVNTNTLVVERTITLQKQIVGFEVGADVFRFFGSRLVDLNTGIRTLEPVQLAVRAVLELATMELVEAVTGVDHRPCLPPILRDEPAPSGNDPGGDERAQEQLRATPPAVGQVTPGPLAAAAQPAPAVAPAETQREASAPPRAPAANQAPPPPAAPPPATAAVPASVLLGDAFVRPRAAVPAQADAGQPPAAASAEQPQTAARVAAADPPSTPAPPAAAAQDGAALASASAPGAGQAGPAPPAGAAGLARRVVILGALSSEDAARQSWQQTRERHAELLGGLAPSIRPLPAGGRTLWFVLVPLPPESSPAALCDVLKGRGTDCVVAPPSIAALAAGGRAPNVAARPAGGGAGG